MRSSLPDFPWDALAPYGEIARSHPSGVIDLSQGTPVDPTPQIIRRALKEASNSPGYPLTAGTIELREAIKKWAGQRLSATGSFDVLPLVGSKELVAWLPTYLESKRVLIPEIAYPTYRVGALLAQCDPIPVAINAATWPQADLAWVNSPSNPTGRVQSDIEMQASLSWAGRNNAIVVSDECYLEFDDRAKPTSILSHTRGENKNVLSLHSLSKRSSMAGYRAAFLIGDPILIDKIREIRKHGGGMVPLPVQKAMVAALSDSEHVVQQRARYNARRQLLIPALGAVGFAIDFSDAGLYIWCTRNEDAWKSVEWLAKLGILATPGIFYGAKGAKHIRIALTATDGQIADAVHRLKNA